MKIRASQGYAKLVVLIVLLVVCAAAWMQSQAIADWFRLRGYEPPTEIAAIADETTMTDDARHLFYINRPALEDKSVFRQKCPDYETTIVIGCYRQGQGGIHVLRVDDPRLEGVEQVTAAHEMLHAAYDRLRSNERSRINGQLEDFARNGLADVRIKETLESYKVTEPGQQANEMYAIFGTEVASLPAELESHYRRFFSKRSEVVAFAGRYQEAFTSRQKQVVAYDDRLNTLGNQIKAATASLEARRDALVRDEQRLESYRQSGDIDRYNAGVANYNQAVGSYNALLESTRGLIDTHNRLVEERNAIAAQTLELRQAIDSGELPESQ